MNVQISLRPLIRIRDDLIVFLDDFSGFRIEPDVDCGNTIGYDLTGYSKQDQSWVYLWTYWCRDHGGIEETHARARLDLDTIFEAQKALEEMAHV